MDAQHGTAHFNLGCMLMRRGDPVGAAKSLRKALEITPSCRHTAQLLAEARTAARSAIRAAVAAAS